VNYILLVLIWSAWCGLHSALISMALTESLRRWFPNAFPYYRIFYNAVALLTLIPVLVYTDSIRGTPWFAWQGPWRLVQFLLILSALLLFFGGSRRYDFLQFLGLRQVKEEKACSVLTDDCQLDTAGVLGMVRHPWYSGGILIVWARSLDLSAILMNLVVSGYFVIGAYLEERKLVRQFGREYRLYQERVSMFFPLKWIGNRLGGGRE
jgi:protein-S-isoprenylcysteine O-methyltransferase Ste14